MSGLNCAWKTSIEKVQQKIHGVKRSHDSVDGDDVRKSIPNNVAAPPALGQPVRSKIRNRIGASAIRSVVSHDALPVRQQLQKVCSTSSGLSQNPLLSLAHERYGLPPLLVQNLTRLGINTMYPWQSSCLLGRGLLTGEKNLVCK